MPDKAPKTVKVRINEVFSAEQFVLGHEVTTVISYQVPKAIHPVGIISVTTRHELACPDYTDFVWSPATISWASIGAKDIEFTRQFAEAMAWAVNEAARIAEYVNQLDSDRAVHALGSR